MFQVFKNAEKEYFILSITNLKDRYVSALLIAQS